MDAPSTTPAHLAAIHRPPSRRRWLRRLALTSAMLLVILLVCHFVWYLSARAELSSARAAAQVVGLIGGQVPAIPPCSDVDNALVRYLQAYAAFGGDHPAEPRPFLGLVHSDREALIATDAASTLALLDRDAWREAWHQMAEAAKLPRVCFDGHVSQEPDGVTSAVKPLRLLTGMGTLRARLLASVGQAQAAADQFADLLWMDRQYRHGSPGITMQCMIGSAEYAVLANLRRALEDGQLSGADLSRCRMALDDDQRDMAWKQAIQDELAVLSLVGTSGARDMLCDVSSHRREHTGACPLSTSWSLYFSWCGAPLRLDDEAVYTRLLTDLYADRQPVGAVSPWLPVSDMCGPEYTYLLGMHTACARLVAAAAMALCARDGGVPASRPGIEVVRGDDGSWTILPTRVARMGLRGYAAIWRVPPRH